MAGGAAKAAKIGRAARVELSHVISDVMLTALNNVTNATPVDTEHAASNWIATFKRPFTEVVGSREAVDWSAHQESVERLRNYDIGRDGNIYIRNNVFYLQFLNEGWSQQAPPGFVAIALAGGVSRAPHGRKQSARKMLRAMARQAYRQTV